MPNTPEKPERAGHKREPEPGHIHTMNEDVPIWDDTPCCCEPEPRWQRLGEEMEQEQASEPRPKAQKPEAERTRDPDDV